MVADAAAVAHWLGEGVAEPQLDAVPLGEPLREALAQLEALPQGVCVPRGVARGLGVGDGVRLPDNE